MLLYWLCVTSSTWISRSFGSRLVPERIGDGFRFIYMQKHCTGDVPGTALLICGCDSVSMFASQEKKMAWSVWQKYPEAIQVEISWNIKRWNIFPNSSKIIGSNKFYFQKNMLYIWTNMSIRFLWLGNLLECLCFIIEASLPSYISNLSIPSVNKEYFTHFLKCHNKPYIKSAMQAYARQRGHHQHKHRLSNTSWQTMQAVLRAGKKK